MANYKKIKEKWQLNNVNLFSETYLLGFNVTNLKEVSFFFPEKKNQPILYHKKKKNDEDKVRAKSNLLTCLTVPLSK